MNPLAPPKTLIERHQWTAVNVPGFREEPDAVWAAELRAQFLQCASEFHQFSGALTSNAMTASRRAHVAEIAGLVAASYLSDLGGLLASW